MKICDLTQFYSPVSGGVKRYVSEKVRFLQRHRPEDEHILIIPGERDGVEHGERSRVYTIRSPLISKTSRYRMLLRLEAIERILEKEKPSIIESGDPYQVAWKAVHSGRALGIPVVGFYHSHFPEAYLRSAEKFLGRTLTEGVMDLSRRYIRSLYNRFDRTIVPSPALGQVLEEWGVRNVANSDLGVDTEIFTPGESDLRAELKIPPDQTLLLYVGRLAHEKNTLVLFDAFRRLHQQEPGRFHLLVVGDGLQRPELEELRAQAGDAITWLPYCSDSHRLAQLYRAADLFVHPGVQETFGLVALEAQACGTPVIGIRGSYMDRIILHDQAFWADANTPEALAEAIREMSMQDLAALGGEISRRVRERYSWDQVFTRLFDLYGQVVAEYERL
ncbi:MAG: glycosyltransferase [Chthoniobacteraceae bacterium]